MAPTRIANRYELQDKLGEGGMGVVWRALDVRLGTFVAVKLMKDVSDPVAVDLFTREWKALAEMSHPNIVDVRDVGVIEDNHENKPFFVMPLLRGATLAELIADASGRLTVTRIVEITTQVCRGLQAAHQRGLIHRDLKPSNIFVIEDDTAKIIDFGVVHLAGSESATGYKGTLQYMSPEQAQLKELTPASDLFSIGVILYEALTLRKPFARATENETRDAVVKINPPSVSEINGSISQPISQVVQKCLAKRAIHRFQSARELAEFLQKACRNEAVFDPAKIQPRIERARNEYKSGDLLAASEILAELEAEGHLDPRISVLRTQIDLAEKEKKVRKLLESARARLEQDEIPLALDKLREVLELDPQNADALAIRSQIQQQGSEKEIAKWFDLAETHLSNRDFGAARQAAQEVLAIRPGDRRVLDLLEKIETTEVEARRIREQKEHLYSAALRAHQAGEIESALSKMERLFSVARHNPSAAVPQRDAVYDSFYKEVRSERDSIRSAMEESQRRFAEEDFDGARSVCQELMVKYPNDPTFQALKIRIEDAKRQKLSAYIAEVSKLVESDPDLDRRVNILKEACEKYPSEANFAEQLKSTRERRDLVNSIVFKARHYEEQGQYSEAISQWDILRNIHSQYPGIGFEIQECQKKRSRQVLEEERASLVEEIDALIGNRSYEQAITRVDVALQDFPGDAELSGLRALAEQRLQSTKEARRLFEDGQRAVAAADLTGATELLRNAFALDPRAAGLRETLITVLVERAQMLLDDNWSAAEPLYQEANQLDSGYPAVRALRSSISEAKRQTFVGQCLAECRSLVANGHTQVAAERIRAARAEYPNDGRLEQYEASLEAAQTEVRREEEKDKDKAALSDDLLLLQQKPDRVRMRAILEHSYSVRKKYPDDPEVGNSVAETEIIIKQLSGSDDLSDLLKIEYGSEKETKIREEPGKKERTEWRKVPLRPAGAIVLALVAVGIGLYVWHWWKEHHPVATPHPPTVVLSIPLKLEPTDSTATADGKPVTTQSLPEGTTVAVSHLGYQTKQVKLQRLSDGTITLEPEPVHVSIQTSEKEGDVELDGTKVAELANGSLDDYSFRSNGKDHQLSIVNKKKTLVTFGFNVLAGSPPEVTNLKANNLFVTSSLGTSVKLYGSQSVPTFHFGDQSITSNPSGTQFDITEENRELKFGEGSEQGSLLLEISNAPGLLVHSVTAEARLAITTNAENATLTMDGAVVQPHRHQWLIAGVTGQHQFEMSAPNYQTQSWTMTLKPGQTIPPKRVNLLPRPVEPVLARLIITGGTPGSEVYLDGKNLGVLDGNGNFDQAKAISSASHTVLLTRSHHFDRQLMIQPSNPARDANVVNPTLNPWPILSFQTKVRNAKVQVRRVGDSSVQNMEASETVQLEPGSYEIVASAAGYEDFTTTVTLGTANLLLPLPFAGKTGYEYADLNQVTCGGDWCRTKNTKEVSLKSGILNVNLTLTRPGKPQFGNKKVEWSVVTNKDTKVHYILEGSRLTRKLEVKHNTEDEKEVTVDLRAGNGKDVSVVISVIGSHIQISNDRHAVQDDYTAPEQDFAGATIMFRPGNDIQFQVKRD